jgi:hypothetical protein
MDGTEDEALAERFFSQPPVAWEIDWHAEPMSSLERVAMLTTVAPLMAMIAVAVTLLISEPFVARSTERGAVSERSAVIERAVIEPWTHAALVVAPEDSAEPAPPATPFTSPMPVIEPVPAPSAARAVISEPAPKRAARTAAKPTRTSDAPLLARARAALGAGDAAMARELAQLAVQAAPEHAAAYIVLAGAYDKLGDRARMHATFRSCAERAQDALAQACTSLAR